MRVGRIHVMTAPMCGSIEALVPVLQAAGSLLFCLDFDGTLAPTAESPDLVTMTEELQDTMRALAAVPAVTIAVISGRSVADLRQRFDRKVICAGCHGLEIEAAGLRFVRADALQLAAVVDQAAWDLEAAVLNVPGVFVERKSLCATLHYRQVQPDLVGWLQSTLEWVLGPYRGLLRISRAHEAWEILPCVEWNKGSALRYLVERSRPSCPFVVCAGDDLTDEDLFAAVENGVSISVGELKPTRAAYRIGDPHEFADFLRAVCFALCGRQAAVPGIETG